MNIKEHVMIFSQPARFLRKLKQFTTDRSGNFGIMFALTAMPVIMAVGMAIDYSIVANAQAKLNSAADSAALAGVVRAKNVIMNAPDGADIYQLNSQAIAEGQAAALKMFAAQAAQIPYVKNAFGSISLSKVEQNINSVFSYTADAQLSFGSFLNMNTIQIKNNVGAQSQLEKFLDIHIVIDNSGSMGVGATPNDIAKMQAGFGCSFGCHILDPEFDDFSMHSDAYKNIVIDGVLVNDVAGRTYYEKAHRIPGVKMKIDVVREAVDTFVKKAKLFAKSPNQLRFSIYTFSNKLVTVYTQPTPVTDYSALETAIASIELEKVTGGTNFQYSIGNQLTAIVPASKSGNDAASRITHVVMFTDGVEDGTMGVPRHNVTDRLYAMPDPNMVSWNGEDSIWHYPHLVNTDGVLDTDGTLKLPRANENLGVTPIQPVKSSICQPLKDKGATVTILLAKYIITDATTISQASGVVNYINDSVLPQAYIDNTIGKCASMDSLHSANSAEDIGITADKIFSKIFRTTRLIY
jgi:hypothetical protein